MRFYDALQLDPEAIKAKMADCDKKGKRRWTLVMLVRVLLLVGFATAFVSALTALFGAENSCMAVVILCILLSVRFVDFRYDVRHSLASLGIVFALLLFSPLVMQVVPPLLGFAINFLSILLICILTCEQPKMGYGGLFLFGYVFLSGNIVTGTAFLSRAMLTLTGFVICGVIFYVKHRHKNKNVPVAGVFQKFSLHRAKSRWQLQVALGVSALFLLNAFLQFDRFIWAGFACASLLTSYPVNIKERLPGRIVGVILGSLAFGAVYLLLPADLHFILGPLSGICLGFCASYRFKTFFNCFGGLSLAVAIYGVGGSVVLRICNNLVGILFGTLFFFAFNKIFEHFARKEKVLA